MLLSQQSCCRAFLRKHCEFVLACLSPNFLDSGKSRKLPSARHLLQEARGSGLQADTSGALDLPKAMDDLLDLDDPLDATLEEEE